MYKEKLVLYRNFTVLNFNHYVMIEKNFDPDNENCPEKETVEHLFKLKHESDNFQTTKEFENSINDVQNNKTEHLEKKEN